MAANSSGQGFQNKNRVAILAELDKEKRKLLMQNQSSTNHPGARIAVICEPCPAHTSSVQYRAMHLVAALESALHSRDPLLIRTSGITLSSSISQPNRRQLCSMLMHIHLGTSSLKTLHLGTLFFLFYLALTQNEENICDGKVTL
ncbi:SOSS complex subunit C isoform X2 [Piliocolobus tephrosceles]|uniref:SOSS complex subunit C isoform X2 n=1 Tax=Piliocolobus tephrosceles TaxID=591936 RepID=UPI000E6B4076|nr:SOSS complex subunit C isoform X2 [Piliocolobus tephrosceles]